MKKLLPTIIICHLSLGAALTSCSGGADGEAMRSQLLRARTMNQEYVPFTTDSVVRQVTDYYDRHGTAAERVEAHYLLGCAYRDLGEAPQALQCFHDAVALADTASDYPLLVKVYGQMAELFDAQNLPTDEIAAISNIQRLALAHHDSLMYIRAVELSTKPYYKLGDTARVIQTIGEASRLYTEAGDSQKAANACATLAHIMLTRGRLALADSLLREFETKTGLMDSQGRIAKGHEMYYYIKAKYYLQTGQTDAAETFLRKLLPHHYPADAYRGLLAVYRKRHQPDSMAKYATLFEAAIDSLNNRRRIETVHQMAALYNYHRYQQKADAEALAAAEARHRANIAIVLMVLFAIAAATAFLRFRKSKQQQLDRISQEYMVVSGLLDKARIELDEARRTAEAKDGAAQNLDSMETEMQEKLEEKTNEVRELEDRLQQVEHYYRTATHPSSIEKKKNSEAVKAIRRRAEWKHGSTLPSIDEWLKLTSQFRLDFPHYYATLTKDKKLATKELRTCMLLMLDFKEGEIAVLLNVKPQRVTNIKKRVNTKLFGDASATTLTGNIQSASALV